MTTLAQKYAGHLVNLTATAGNLATLTRDILNNADNRSFMDDVREASDMSLSHLQQLVEMDMKTIERNMALLKAALYVQDVELANGKGDWREVADTEHTIKAVVALRRNITELSVSEAKAVVEGYKAGIFK